MGHVGSAAGTPETFGVATTKVGFYERLNSGRPVVLKATSTPGPFDTDGTYVAQIVG